MAVSNVELRVDSRQAVNALRDASTASEKLGTAVNNTNTRLRDANGRFLKFGESVDEASDKVKGLQQAFAALGAGIAAARIGQYLSQGVQGFADLDNALRRLGTVGGDVKALDGELGRLSGSFGNLVSKTELAQASYDALSAGFTDTAGNIAILEASTKAAVGGQVEVADALQVTTKVLNAYGLSGEYATGVTDSISKAIEFGVVQWSDYTSQLGRVVSLAALAGVSLDEVNAFIAAATKNGATAEVAFTGLSAALSTLTQPTKESQEAAKQLGISWNISGLQAKGFNGLLADLAKVQGSNVEASARLLGSQEAMRGVFAANAKGGKDFQMILAGLGSAAGKTEADFQKMEVGLTNQLKRLGNNWEALRTTIIQAVIPSILDAVDKINKALETSIQYVKDYAAGWQILASAAADAVKPFESIASALGTINGQLAAIGTHKNAMAILAGFLPGGPLGPLLNAPAQLGAAKRMGGEYVSPFAGAREETFNRIKGLPTPGLAAQSPYVADGGGTRDKSSDKAAKEAERVTEVIKDRLAEGQLTRIKSELQDKITAAETSGDKMLASRLQSKQKEIDLQYRYAQELAKEKNIRAQEAIIFAGQSELVANERDLQRDLAELQRQAAKDQITALEALIGKQYELTEQQKQQKTLAEGITNTVGQGMTSAFDALIQGSEDFSTSLRKIASGVLIDIANQLLQVFVIQKAISAIGGLLGGGITGGGGFSYSGVTGSALGTSMLSGNFTATPFSTVGLGLRANGGSVTAGKPYMVGERGPELFMPGRSGGIAPANSFGGGVNVVVNVDATGSSVQGDQSQAKQLGGVISAAVQSELIKQKRPGGLLA
jgi:TP901 family phage tail tape measure protein